jgi:recombinational DNA repair protein (RecF pathway)
MIEHATWGVVLDRTRDDELDTEYSIFTWDLGKVKARATSVRKITSKLAGHLEPGSLIRLRLVQKAVDGNFKIVESLIEERTKDQAAVKAMLFVDQMTGLLQADIYMFAFLKGLAANEISGGEVGHYRRILTLLGFDPENATCSVCNEAKIAYFIPQDIMFLCHQCLQKVKQSSDRSGISLRSS